jgi:Protein of unknown function (DUF3667)
MAISACANCGAPLGGEYCARCGQRAVKTNPTLSEFLHDTTHELLQWDGKIPRTLKTLFLRPGVLTVDFLAGRRARWLSPLRVYLICSIAFFASRPVIEAITGRSFRQIAQVTFTDTATPGVLSPAERERLRNAPTSRFFSVEKLERAAANPERLNREVDAAFPRAMFILLPVLALLTNLAWRRAQPRYPTHLYVALHLNALWFGAMTMLGLVIGIIPFDSIVTPVGLLFLIYIVWYSLVACHRIFGDSWPRTLLKSIVVGGAYLACVLTTGLLLLGYAITRM